MKGIVTLVVVLMLTVTTAFSADFAPQVLKLSASEIVQYDFDGSELSIPVTVSGTQASILFSVFTKGKADEISGVQNGFLGWHYVNNIDTCLYMSTLTSLGIGAGTISWDGKDADGGVASAGEYTYYMWAYNGEGSRVLACQMFGSRGVEAGQFRDYDEDNLPIAAPEYYPPYASVTQVDEGGYDGSSSSAGIKTRAKWVMGGDPMDEALAEYTTYSGWRDTGKIAFLPEDHSNFFVLNMISDESLQIVRKFKWVPNGESEQDTDWGDDGKWTVTNTSKNSAGPISDNIENLWVIIADQSYPEMTNPNQMYYLDIDDGSQTRMYDFAWLYTDPDEWARGYKMHNGPANATFKNVHGVGRIVGTSNSHCVLHCIDPTQEDDEDVTLWYNDQGDYVADRFFEETRGEDAWLCTGGSGPPWKYDLGMDANGFTMFHAYDLGAVSFGLMAPDGTGIGYFPIEGAAGGELQRGLIYLDNGSAFDGIYCDNLADTTNPNSFWYIAHDSITGTITSAVSVDEDAPAAFAVAQNSPNPFNPTTTINFALAEAGNVSVEVYNVAGQKVDTIVNEFMNAGSQSVVWNASDFSAGVYFYTVKSDDYSKTIKMTLIK